MLTNRYLFLLTAMLISSLTMDLCAQNPDKLLEFLTFHPNKKAAEKDSTLYPAKAIFTPVITYTPETNLSLGLGIKGLFKMRGSGPETRTSNIPLTIQYTIENKYLFFSGFEIFFPQERYMITGNVRVQSFPSLYYGIGRDTPKSNREEFNYKQILLEPLFLKNVLIKHLFVGGGFRFNKIYGIEAISDGLLENAEQNGNNGSTSTGVELALIYDSRDNILNATKGAFYSITYGLYQEELGGSNDFRLLKVDLRYFFQPFGKAENIIGIQLYGHFSNSETPLFEHARLGGSERMRGHFEGRYTDKHMISSQVEFRQKLTERWGMVVFAGAGTVASEKEEFNLEHIRPTVGAGIRYLIDKEENLNIRVDFGVGNEKSNYYLKLAEAF